MDNFLLILGLTTSLFFFKECQCERNLFPNLPVGEFRFKFKVAFKCNTSTNYKIDLNLHQSKVSKNKILLVGNIDLQIPFDDLLSADVNVAVMDKIGGWKDNAFIYNTKNACSTIKSKWNEGWIVFIKSSNISDNSCPIKANNYVVSNLDVDEFFVKLQKTNIFVPKTFFYGSYKLRLAIKSTGSSAIVGCLIIIVDIVRPWEYF
ncbi:uncharacterized protein LOC126909214 [Daktulosphaira vitifoliae]|uniref:uncharacterized protein LOC126909214 n=1 Tax=Daktulosphaira vitifoliae TaxID=58002 RepID=UPI0021AA203F|nr:uncharacterized protein LOC126909214 [Daktulosphaira vitifoliae]